MKTTIKFLIILFFLTILISCGNSNNTKTNNFSIETNAENNTITLGDTLEISLKNSKNLKINLVTYQLDDNTIESPYPIQNLKLGAHKLTATITYDDTSESISTQLFILNNESPKIFTYKIINEYPHDITSYTQGLEFHNGELYESTGHYGESKLRKVDYKTAEVLKNIDLSKDYF
jgi:glutaminyl-peptide cyclotransferase